MWRLSLLLLVSYHIATTCAQNAALAQRLDKLFQKIERLSVTPTRTSTTSTTQTPNENLYAKLDILNAIKPKDSNTISPNPVTETYKTTTLNVSYITTANYQNVSTTINHPNVSTTINHPNVSTTINIQNLSTNINNQNVSTNINNQNISTNISNQNVTTNQTTKNKFVVKIEDIYHHPVDVYKKVNVSERNVTAGAENGLTEEDDELLSMMQMIGKMNPDQLENVAAELLRIKGGHKVTLTDYEAEWDDEMNDLSEIDYPNDDWDNEYGIQLDGVTPSAFTKDGNPYPNVDPIEATNQRPRKIYEKPSYISHYLADALAHIKSAVTQGQCHTPQRRWISVRQLAPAADTIYMPAQVLLHRCTGESGCCLDQTQHCAPINGEYVTLPFYLNKANGNFVARIVFYNHTRCGCVSKIAPPRSSHAAAELGDDRSSQSSQASQSSEGQVVRRQTKSSRELLNPDPYMYVSTDPPQLIRCTCPALFQAKMDKVCSCTCDWPDNNRRRDCLSLSRGREHFGLRDRVCVASGDCTKPTCDFGFYDVETGKCPIRRLKRFKYPHKKVGG